MIDNLELLQTEKLAEQLSDSLSAMPEGFYTLLAGRAQLPVSIRSLCAMGVVSILDKGFITFTTDEMEQLYLSYGLTLTPTDISYLKEVSYGWPYGQHVLAQKLLKQPEQPVRSIWLDVFIDLQHILMADVIYALPEHEQHFLYNLSPFSQFSEEMARVITGRIDAPKLLLHISQKSHILFSNIPGQYFFISFVRQALFRELTCLYSDDYIRGLYRRVALYYELQNQIPLAVSIYVRLKDHEKVRELLIRSSQLRPADGQFVELQAAYRFLDKEVILTSPELMKGMCLIESFQGHAEASEYWYQELEQFVKKVSQRDARHHAAEEIIAYLDIVLPHRGSNRLLNILIATARLNRWTGSESWRQGFNIAGYNVSLLNGGKDFCRWIPHGQRIYRLFHQPIEAALGQGGRGLGDLALAECYLEMNLEGRYEEAYQHTYQGLSLVENDIEMQCAGVGIQSRILAAQGNAVEAVKVIDHLIASLSENSSSRLRQNLEIHRLWLLLLQGKTQECLSWLNQSAPDETKDFVILDRYGYLLKLRLYIIAGRFMETQMLCGF